MLVHERECVFDRAASVDADDILLIWEQAVYLVKRCLSAVYGPNWSGCPGYESQFGCMSLLCVIHWL